MGPEWRHAGSQSSDSHSARGRPHDCDLRSRSAARDGQLIAPAQQRQAPPETGACSPLSLAPHRLSHPDRASSTDGGLARVAIPQLDRLDFNRILNGALWLLGIGAAYFALAKLGLQVASINPSATPIWPPTGFALATLLLCGYKVWP